MIFEFLAGGTVIDEIEKKDDYTEKEAKNIIMPIFDALKYLHDRGIIHGDLKMNSLLYSSAEEQNRVVKVTSPETFVDSSKYGQSDDLWSIGVVLHTLLYGNAPFKEEDEEKFENDIRSGNLKF